MTQKRKETKQEQKNRLRNQMREDVLEPAMCEDKYNITLTNRKMDLDYPEKVTISIPRRIDHWLRNWAKANGQLVSKRLEMFLKLNNLDMKLARQPERTKDSDPHSIRWHLHNGNITREEAVSRLCTLYPRSVSEEILREFLAM